MSSIDELKHLHIPLYAISLATNGFAMENLIGSGGFGQVYKGYSEKHGNIAIKRLDRMLGQGDREFKTEIALLSVYKHENISCLYGFCDEDGEKILVYKYESKGSLDKYLDSKDLTWIQRIRICIDACNGLRYLHDDVGPQHRIIHRDVKSSNILLDENWRAKVSDFGLSKIGPANVGHTFLISNVCGTVGYIDPEYLDNAVLTKESDVYSFGVVLFEVLCGKPAHFQNEGQLLYALAQKHFETGTLDEIIHPDLQKEVNATSLATFSTIAYQSLKKRRKERPTMKKVMEQLQKALIDQLVPSGSCSSEYDGFNVDLVAPHQGQFGLRLNDHGDINDTAENNLAFLKSDTMNSINTKQYRIVRCPSCSNLLPEPFDSMLYQCGGCFAILKAKNSTNDKVHKNTTTDGDLGFLKSDTMSNKMSTKPRLVRCPHCLTVLPEPPNTLVFRCGGCFATLRQADKKNSTTDTRSK